MDGVIERQRTDDFRRLLHDFYIDHGRHDLLWRQPEADGSYDPYKILVSELMLQQTQVSRVTPKYQEFVERFPTLQSLAAASLGEVLQLWNGLGYNRRAKYLWLAAQAVVRDSSGVFPRLPAELLSLPGVGRSTAGAITAYAFDLPATYVETNIRTVMIHHFFRDKSDISDVAILAVLSQIVKSSCDDADLSPREFYWAMMDYGTCLKQTVGNLNQASSSYTRQSVFAGSRRQLRGKVIRLLTEQPYRLEEIMQLLDDDRVQGVLDDLVTEKMIVVTETTYSTS